MGATIGEQTDREWNADDRREGDRARYRAQGEIFGLFRIEVRPRSSRG